MRRVGCVWLICSLLLLAACHGDDADLFQGSSVTGVKLGQDWALQDLNGQTRTPQDFIGDLQLVFFGFTQCPDVCPTTLATVAQTMSLLGEQAKGVQVLMVTVDPERDTPDVMTEYLHAFDAELPRSFVGLTGTSEAIRQTAGAFRAYYAKVPTPDGDYTMDHSASIYLLDQQGQARVMFNEQVGAEVMAHDIGVLLSQNQSAK